MNETEFNLIDEPWIRVMDKNCEIEEVSLTDAIVNAHNYKSLKGELPTQDVAVMRLILAVLHTVFSRFDEDGNESQLEDDEEDAEDRWKSYWENESFSEKTVKEYLEKWHERFWLFHPERPFFQVANLKIGTDYDASKLNGEVSESSNKIRLFSSYSGEEKEFLNYSQAARWLLYLNAYDDTSSKPTTEGKKKAGGSLPSPGIGWLGKLGLIYIEGNNLFETLMLNLAVINNDIVQYKQNPIWEHEFVSSEERTEIVCPDNLAELYTIQSRRILLNRTEKGVVSYKLLGGDFFEKENAFSEPMTVWRVPKGDSKSDDKSTPKRHDSTKQLWRNFSSFYSLKLSDERKNQRAGIINWYANHIYGESLIDSDYTLKTVITSVEYGDKDFFVKNVYSDSLSMHSAILTKLGESWRNDIELEIERCEKITFAVSNLARNLYIADGGSDNPKDTEASRENAKAQLYYRLDMPFRKWLNSINPEIEDTDYCDDKKKEWHENAIKIAISYGNELVNNASETAFIGHMVSDKNGKKEMCSAPKALNIYKGQVNKIYKDGDK